jgi:uncharacterized protein (TIGR02453 family)
MGGFFSEATFNFLGQLAENNRREWFQEHKQQYEDAVRTPALAFINAMQPHLAEMAPYFVADARKMGGSLMRVHRDTRFSKDKTPYKTNIGIQFRHELGKDVHSPGYYLHISNANVFVGAGIWHPEADALARIRQTIDEQPVAWLGARDDVDFSRWFYLDGESLKRPPRGFSQENPLIDDIKRKDFIGISDLAPALIEQDDFDQIARDYFSAATPLMRFLCKALRIPF